MASISRERVVLLLCLISDAVGNTLENKCKNTVKDKSIPVSFCNEQHVKHSSITLDAYLPSFDASSFFCMCEVKILNTQSFSSLLISQENTLIPPLNCGLQLKIANATGTIRTVNCSSIGAREYLLYQGSSIVISLANIFENWSEGFCFHLSMRFVNSTISVQCFNPGVTIVPSQPYTTDTPTASTTVSAVTNTSSFLSTTNIDTSTAGVDKETTTPVKTSSTGKEDVTSVKKVIYTADFNVLYAVIPVIGVILIGILCLVFIWYRRRRDAKKRLYSREKLQTSTASSSNDTDTHPQNKAYRETDTANHTMKNDPEFYYYDDQPTQQTTLYATVYKGATSKGNNPKRTSHYMRNKEGKDISRSDFRLEQTARNNSRGSSDDTPVVYVTVNGGERFIL